MEIGELLYSRGLLDQQQVEMARSQTNGRRVDQVAVDMGMISEEDALCALADELGMRYVDLKDIEIDPELPNQVSDFGGVSAFALAIARKNGRVEVATSDPFDLEALDELSAVSGCRLEPVLARRSDVEDRIKDCLGVSGDTIGELVAQRSEDGVELLEDINEEDGELAEMAQAASVIRLVNELLIEALNQTASDVHIEPQERGLTVRFRVDGMLRVQPVPPEINHFYAAIVTRLKIMSRLNIAEKRLPQDGRIKLRVQGREIDVRVSIIPMLYGEGVVMRLLDKERMNFQP